MTAEVRGAPTRPLEVGDRFEQVVRVLGIDIESDWEVTRVQAPSVLELEGTSALGARARLVERITTVDGATRVELEVHYELPLGPLGDAVDAVYAEGKIEQQAEEILDSLKMLCERGISSSA